MAVVKLSQEIFGNSEIIGKTAFEDALLKNVKLSNILTSSGLRSYVVELAKSNMGPSGPLNGGSS